MKSEYEVTSILEKKLHLIPRIALVLGSGWNRVVDDFDPIKKLALSICKKEKIPYQEGVYMYLRGPHYETFADKRAQQALGADVVGMSMVPETIMANRLGVKVLGLSCVTNLAFVKHSHSQVVKAAEDVSGKMAKLLKGVIEGI